jgi:hypothetical protein
VSTRTVDAVDGLAAWRLRPGVAVTLLREGIHLRGRRSSVTLEGSRALPALWRMLDAALRTGDQAALAQDAPAGSPVRAALGTLVAQLHAHDLLVGQATTTAPAADGSVAVHWLRAVADRPGAAAAAIASARPRVLSNDARGPLAQAAGRALTRSGATPSYAAAAGGVPGQILVVGSPPDSGERVAVAAGMSGDTAFVTAPGSLAQARADAAALTDRLGLTTTAAEDDASPALTALVAGAAAQRLLCAVAGMPDPAHEGDDLPTLPNRPAVLIATARPFQASYHCWLGPDLLDADRTAAVAPPGTLAEALRRVAALGDEVVGVLAPPLPGALPQLPVALAACAVPDGTLLAGAARVDLARLDAICRAAELRLAEAEFTVSVGVDPSHARGRALRRAAARLPVRSGATVLPDAPWLSHPQARHWWNTLTERLGVRAELTVTQLTADEPAFHAAVRDASGRLLGDAVEATPADAAAFAALAATANMTISQKCFPSGASAPIATAGAQFAGWEDDGWTTTWLTGVASREAELQTSLRQLTGLRATEPHRPTGPDAQAVAAALHGCGFTVLSTVGGTP